MVQTGGGRHREAPSAVDSQGSGRRATAANPATRSGWARWSCGCLIEAIVTRLLQSFGERLVIEDDARRNSTGAPIAHPLDFETIVTRHL